MAIFDNVRYGQIEADAHQTTLHLLTEVADYLNRLPAHPMTHAMIQKVQSHLANPMAKAQNARLAMLAEDQTLSAKIQSGDGFKGTSRLIPSGAPVIAARLLYPRLRLESPAVQDLLNAGEQLQADTLSAAIGREIAEGVTINLSPIHPIIDRVWLDPKAVMPTHAQGDVIE